MADVLLTYLRRTLPEEVAAQTESYLAQLESGDYQGLLQCPEARILFGHEQSPKLQGVNLEEFPGWNDFIFHRLGAFLADRSQAEALRQQTIVFCIGYAALLAFVQSNVTGPPLAYKPADLVLPPNIVSNPQDVRQNLLAGLSMDGIAAYKLTPHIELLCLADAIATSPPILKNITAARWAKMRVAFFQQRLLSEVSSTLQNVIYDDLDVLEYDLAGTGFHTEFVLERSTIHIHHGLDKLARQDLEAAKDERHFEFALTGLLGKRTKFQQKDVSQLVVLAKSAGGDESDKITATGVEATNGSRLNPAPEKLDLNDDTLLESISFSEKPQDIPSTTIQGIDSLAPSLKELDPENQPQLQPLDSTILLSLASSISNTQPEDGLTREETLPYATRVLDGGSSNWQIYTQALLVRSRIEGYRARTIERGLLQLQALVDQVIAETKPDASSSKEGADKPNTGGSTFLPKAKESESALVTERLRYIFQLATPTRWELEAELASRWVQLGGLRSALEIYERLELWAEAALCWAATEREDKARQIVRRQLFHATNNVPDADVDEDEEWTGPARSPLPLDAPRLYCILGDIDQSIPMYEEAWRVSNERYARAQRSIGRHFFQERDMVRAAQAYSKALKVNQLNHQSWFALGCALLELAQFGKAGEAFSRCVQLDETDAEAWSNLAAALLRSGDEKEAKQSDPTTTTDDSELLSTSSRQSILHDALQALKRAASLKHESHRIWSNVLIVAASLTPPDYPSLLKAQRQILTLRGKTEGEGCIDVPILNLLVTHVISSSPSGYDATQPGLGRMVVKFFDEAVIPVITSSAELWYLVSRLALWRNKPSAALSAEESAWRAITTGKQPPWYDTASDERWTEVVDATVRLCEMYESLGERERTEGLGAGSAEVVMKEWRFKARTAVRGIMGRGKDGWEESEGWEKLKVCLAGLKG